MTANAIPHGRHDDVRKIVAMRMLPLFLGLSFLAAPLHATTIYGSDYHGGDLTTNNNDILLGTFTNVGLFSVGPGVRVTVAPTVPLVIYAATVSISGILDGTGRGESGGLSGPVSGAGSAGLSGGPAGAGGATGGAAAKGAGAGAGYAAGGSGAGDSGGGAGAAGGTCGAAGCGSTGTLTIPLSSDDIFPGSGGGGGGGGSSLQGGTGSSGGAAVYLEAASMTVSGTILVSGDTATPVAAGAATYPGAGGGGGGGTLLLRITGTLQLADGARLSANGGGGGNVDTVGGGQLEPGGGGGGGLLKIFSKSMTFGSVILSTAAGPAGSKDAAFTGTVDAAIPPQPGETGKVSFGVIASSPTGFAAQAVYVTSISWAWNATASFGDGPATSYYRIFPATVTAPYPAPESTPLPAGTTVLGLTPNTTYYRFVTAFTDWGDSLPSNAVSTHTLANIPGAAAAAFTGMADNSLTLNWTAGAPANPDYTSYQVDRALDSGFTTGAQTGFVTALSSSPAALTPNTTYYFRVRAVNIDGVPTSTTTMSTATWASKPPSTSLGTVYVTSAVFQWSAGANPADTIYMAQVSSDNFFSLTATSSTLSTCATFFSLTPGTQYYFKVKAVNRDLVPTDFTTSVSTKSGNLSDTTQPEPPGTPASDRRFSYDGAAVFSWPAAASPVGILDYDLIIGSTPGGSDFFNGSTTTLSYAATGLSSGRTYYARVRARSNAGVYSEFSGVSAGVPVFITSQTPVIPKPYNWPNPFNPSQGPTQIGVYLNEPAFVVLRIYTLTGTLVREISQSVGGSGNQVVTWDGNSSSGAKVAPGGYIIKVEKRYSDGTEVQKLKVAVVY